MLCSTAALCYARPIKVFGCAACSTLWSFSLCEHIGRYISMPGRQCVCSTPPLLCKIGRSAAPHACFTVRVRGSAHFGTALLMESAPPYMVGSVVICQAWHAACGCVPAVFVTECESVQQSQCCQHMRQRPTLISVFLLA
jgi:hypothetical protein